jgi:hypothetical protein
VRWRDPAGVPGWPSLPGCGIPRIFQIRTRCGFAVWFFTPPVFCPAARSFAGRSAAAAAVRGCCTIPASPAGRVVASLAAAFFLILKSAHGAVLQLWQIRTVCGFAFLFALPCLAEEGARNVVMLDVASGGLLGALATAVIVWLNNHRKRDAPRRSASRPWARMSPETS